MEKALILEYDLATDTKGAGRMSVQFNPEHYQIQKTNDYSTDDLSLDDATRARNPQFIRSQLLQLTTELLFDSYNAAQPDSAQEDVRTKFQMLSQSMRVKRDKHIPPGVQFAWGKFSFTGALTSVSEQYLMFSNAGVPVRAKLSIQITGWPSDEQTAPNESPDRTKLHVVKQKETLLTLAQEEYGSAEQWRVIALANGIENPRKIADTTRLIVPALPGGEA